MGNRYPSEDVSSNGLGYMTDDDVAVETPRRVDLERIRPGMSAEEMQRVREEIVRVASQTLKGM